MRSTLFRAWWIALALGPALGIACSGGSSNDSASSPDAAVGTDGPGGPTGSEGGGAGGGGGGTPDGGGVPDGSLADGGGGNPDGSDGAVTYTPKALPGLVLWLEGSLGLVYNNVNYLVGWNDQSGNGNDATLAPGSDGLSSFNPTSRLPAPGYAFNEEDSMVIADAPSLQWGTGDFLVAAVALNNFNDPTGAGGNFLTYPDGRFTRCRYGEVYSKATGFSFGPAPVIAYNDWNTETFKTVGSVDGFTLLEGSWDAVTHLLVLRRHAGVVEFRRDGTVLGTMADAGAIDVSNVGTPVAIGGRAGKTFMAGAIMEIVAVKGTTSDADLATFESYIKTKYAGAIGQGL
jgi:hypothetical protein